MMSPDETVFPLGFPIPSPIMSTPNVPHPPFSRSGNINPVPLPMNFRISKFCGYANEDAERFLLEFESYATLNNLQGDINDARKVAAFHLHLDGPARVWFLSIAQKSQFTWGQWRYIFSEKYITNDNNPALVAEAEYFDHLVLAPGQQLENFHSLVLQKGEKLGKHKRDILIKFIKGLPEKLAFFVRAGNPQTHEAALYSAQMGEAYGYRVHQVNAAYMREAADTTRPPPTAVGHPLAPPRREFICYRCDGSGHVSRFCNLHERGQKQPDIQCQICMQKGHSALDCKKHARQRGNDPVPYSGRREAPVSPVPHNASLGSNQTGN